MKGERDFTFSGVTNAVPLMTAEFIEAQGTCPIVFVGNPVHPAAVLGLGKDNAFVTEGVWAEGRYIPAYVRRYPFVFIETVGGAQLALGVDMASDRIVSSPEGGDGLVALFTGDEPSQFTRDALAFSAALQASQIETRAFCAALVTADLLVDQQAHGTLSDGTPFNVQGFRVVDAAKFAALPDDVVSDWHRKGWLALVHYHLASLARFRDLLALAGAASQPLEALAAHDAVAAGAAPTTAPMKTGT
ncbi:SapC family protein [Sphingomonas sp. QA11]|uniref:SapC family protein n=1 Tax=Sphingomonas sp. QA11 TaxID=2950605 RepID=UPI003FA7C7A4|nr:SapC family protein [Sphingomonas sp. QA11]